MEKHTIRRDGFPPLVFNGELIGRASSKTANATRWTDASIYRTQAGKYVVVLGRITQWEDETSRTKAEAFATPMEVIEWLKEDSTTLGAVSQEAVESAAAEDPAFAEAWVQRVD